MAERIRSALGSGDIVARLGGDKFGIIKAGQPQPQSAAALASRLLDLIGRSHLIEGHLIDIAASVGIVLLPTDAADYEQLLKNVDLALHRAKSDGQGTYRFFESAMDDLVGRAIVRAVVGIGQSLGMATVAEGIETEEQLARIVAEGCTEAQGYLFGRPMPPEQIEAYLSSRSDAVLHEG